MSAVARARALCRHCSEPLPRGERGDFCCRGCAEVHRLLAGAGLEQYYALGGGRGYPVLLPEGADHKWLEPILASRPSRLALDVQGIHCSACVWLIEQLFARMPGAGRIVVNPALGTAELAIDETFDLRRFVEDVEAFGYRLGPALKRTNERQSDLVWRMGVCIAIAMNTMIFGFAVYSGLTSGPVYRLFHALDFGLSLISVLVGGTVFFRSAWTSVKQRVLHLDLPIALGIALVFASSTYTYWTRGGASSYFDTLDVFIALMLVGRFLQERVLAKNRAMLLASDGADGVLVRRLAGATEPAGARAELVRATELAAEDVILAGRGDLVPVDAVLLEDGPRTFSLDWINGESAPRVFSPGAVVPAGAFAQDERASRLRARTAFDRSALSALLRTDTRRDEDLPRATDWHRRLTRVYVLAVLVVATLTFAGWLAVTRDVARTFDVVAAVLIVTCPCAFGIATPLAYELAQASLRKVGLYVRTPGFLDRAAGVERVVFDKTGTLTTGRLQVQDVSTIASLHERDRRRLYALAAQSSHPKSRAIAEALTRIDEAPTLASAGVRELPGKGMELVEDGHVYRLGARGWALAPAELPSLERRAPRVDVVFTRDGKVLSEIATTEELRRDAAAELRALERLGYETFLLSGDGAAATKELAATCGIRPERAFGGRSPEGKREWLARAGDAPTLFVGDGINDSLVAEAAECAGTPAIDRPFMAARSDFYFVAPGLRPIRAALLTARRLASVVRLNLGVALAYNAITVSLAVMGLMTPLLCAVLMPVSSLSTVLVTTLRLEKPWTS
ncbi:MAG: HAD-IC family P-type ATPase [Labilithrix sp.]|nr:HAD-IC family P-type ATPase [Labilithrix sp.]MCW5812522.1 HAD-IC family P-type ATPase [Labilithrix sp.]